MSRSEPTRVKITKTEVDALPVGGRIVDAEIKGFMARRLPSGKVAYGYRYRMKGKPQQWKSLGVHGDGGVTAATARREAASLQGKVADRIDPVATAKAEAETEAHALRVKRNTVNVVLDSFLKEYVREKKLRSADQIERAFKLHIRPHIGTLPVHKLSRDDINPMLKAIRKDAGPVARDRALAHLRKALNWYQIGDSKFINPIVKGMAGGGSTARDRILADDEIRSLWAALDSPEVPEVFADIVRVLLLTGQRRSDVSMMRGAELDGDMWTIPAGRYKNAGTHFVPLTEAARKWIPDNSDGFLFSTATKDRPLGKRHYSAYSKGKAALDRVIAKQRKADGLPAMQGIVNGEDKGWTLHDLRRTARSLMSRAKVAGEIGEMVIGHKLSGVRGIYDRHTYAEEKRDALERLATLIDRIINPPAGNVVQMVAS